ncbi:SYF2 splicing factor family protein [Talaromyces proteolyticus]|uniref:Pre-mRNA-splicing factor SYF2 n=1 Tax=Talaromyces proteolyticus TaxID=1131652 RepID=A0AAD4Q5N8_9EURO|nr:SYF2 splicing factor family protein [Talaromyces proteolyticus]KAH8704180.1 SYF2 splicing factor family protein [Talaromyces proteolyticus]
MLSSKAAKARTDDAVEATLQESEVSKINDGSDDTKDTTETATNGADDVASKAQERLAKFKALKARAKNATDSNLKETAAESQRLSTDPALLSSLSRKHAFASHNLLKADTEAAGEDFERKRAWDWTVEESERWDKRMDKKQRHRDDVAFQDYRQDARKIYKRQMRELQPDLDAYEREKMAAVERAAASGGLEIVETNDGELVAVDKNGSFYTTADSTDFVENKPDRAAVDKLVSDIRKAEEVRLKKRRERRGDDDPDVTYINEKNKQFNQKLARFYDKVSSPVTECLLFYNSLLIML